MSEGITKKGKYNEIEHWFCLKKGKIQYQKPTRKD